MPKYEVKTWIIVDAIDKGDAECKAGEFVDSLKPDGLTILGISLEGDGAVYLLDEDEEGEVTDV